ncbi:MAG: hypothetical protein AB6733_10630 [Clostridiaceae bacterium]
MGIGISLRFKIRLRSFNYTEFHSFDVVKETFGNKVINRGNKNHFEINMGMGYG